MSNVRVATEAVGAGVGDGERVYAVHATRPDDIGAVEVVFRDEGDACVYACDRSRDLRVLAVSVTEFVLGQLGTRHPVAWYRDGELQQQRSARPGRLYPAQPWTDTADT